MDVRISPEKRGVLWSAVFATVYTQTRHVLFGGWNAERAVDAAFDAAGAADEAVWALAQVDSHEEESTHVHA